MRVNLAALCLAAFAGAGVCYGQTAPAPAVTTLQPGYSTVYCSGFVKDTKLPEDIRVISGEQPGYKVIFAQRENVYINRGSDNGVRIGDRFLVVRQTEDPDRIEWFKGQTKIAKAMGILYSDIGQLRGVSVESKTSVAEVVFSCEYMLRGDIVRPFDHFAPVSGKPVGTVVISSTFQEGQAQGITMYVNLGAAQGVKIGDYL